MPNVAEESSQKRRFDISPLRYDFDFQQLAKFRSWFRLAGDRN
jgi:hypothetical protein